MKRRSTILLLGVFAWWTLEGLVTAGQLLTMPYDGVTTVAVGEALRRGLLSAWLWVPCSLALIGAAWRFPMESGQLHRTLPLMLAATLLVVLVRAVMIYGLNPVLGWYAPLPSFREVLLASMLNNFLLGWLNVGIGNALVFWQRAYDAQRRAEGLRVELVSARLQALRSQLDPHFLFNALNSIAEMVHRDPDAADRMLVGLGGLLRASLDNHDQALVPLHDELQLLQHYLDIEQARLGDRLVVDWHVEGTLANALVPPLMLQPLAENAIRHAIATSIKPGHLDISVQRVRDELEVTIRDDGPGLHDPLRDGTGLGNLRARLACLYGERHALVLANDVRGGCVVAVTLPLVQGGSTSMASAA